MHEGFRDKDWRVERTPINTPDSVKTLTSMVPQLSDEEEEAAPRATRDTQRRGGVATTRGRSNARPPRRVREVSSIIKDHMRRDAVRRLAVANDLWRLPVICFTAAVRSSQLVF